MHSVEGRGGGGASNIYRSHERRGSLSLITHCGRVQLLGVPYRLHVMYNSYILRLGEIHIYV